MNSSKTFVRGEEVIKFTEEKRSRKFLWFFDVDWWEVVSREHVGNDIHIKTDAPIRNVYLNGVAIRETN